MVKKLIQECSAHKSEFDSASKTTGGEEMLCKILSWVLKYVLDSWITVMQPLLFPIQNKNEELDITFKHFKKVLFYGLFKCPLSLSLNSRAFKGCQGVARKLKRMAFHDLKTTFSLVCCPIIPAHLFPLSCREYICASSAVIDKEVNCTYSAYIWQCENTVWYEQG